MRASKSTTLQPVERLVYTSPCSRVKVIRCGVNDFWLYTDLTPNSTYETQHAAELAGAAWLHELALDERVDAHESQVAYEQYHAISSQWYAKAVENAMPYICPNCEDRGCALCRPRTNIDYDRTRGDYRVEVRPLGIGPWQFVTFAPTIPDGDRAAMDALTATTVQAVA